jgi:hypothetical protein
VAASVCRLWFQMGCGEVVRVFDRMGRRVCDNDKETELRSRFVGIIEEREEEEEEEVGEKNVMN